MEVSLSPMLEKHITAVADIDHKMRVFFTSMNQRSKFINTYSEVDYLLEMLNKQQRICFDCQHLMTVITPSRLFYPMITSCNRSVNNFLVQNGHCTATQSSYCKKLIWSQNKKWWQKKNSGIREAGNKVYVKRILRGVVKNNYGHKYQKG